MTYEVTMGCRKAVLGLGRCSIIAHGEDLSFIGIQNTDMEESSIHAEEIKRVYYTNPGMLDEAKKRQSFTDLSSKFCQYKIPYEEGDYIYVFSLMKAENAVTFLGTSQGMVEGNVIDNALRIAPGELGGSMASGDGENAYAKKPSAQIIRIVCIIVGLVACVLCVRVFIRRKRK